MSPAGAILHSQGEHSRVYGVTRQALCLFLLVCLGITFSEVAQATGDPAQPDCIEGAVTLPLLGGSGDSPIIPATLDSRPIALYFSHGFDKLYVGNMDGFDTYDTHQSRMITTNGVYTDPQPLIRAGHLTIGPLDMGTPDMIQLEDYPTQKIGTRPLIGVIGREAFSNLAVLIDMPHSAFALIRFSHDAACRSAQAALMGTGAQALPLYGKGLIAISIDGVERDFSLDPDAPVTTIPAKWLAPVKDDPADPTGNPGVALYGTIHSRLRRTTVTSMRLGDLSLGPMSVYVQDDLAMGLLGTDFFQNHIVLFDEPNDRLYVLPSAPLPQKPGNNLHFDRFRTGRTSVKDLSGKAHLAGQRIGVKSGSP
ncbi:hypothetical protein C0V97_00715 [Asaia sp. W19]|uniref:hypothetical protein n=1 Tax=unclassified Asaia TaxID=2685023 RepID=UPI000F8C6C01|nr:hypothetical protein [Asaia sp. W19]RUT27626.1 hypothetical protein C0V97_00715 [Asaia sp. W19]